MLQIDRISRDPSIEKIWLKNCIYNYIVLHCQTTCSVFNGTKKCNSCCEKINIPLILVVWIIWVLRRQVVEIRNRSNFSDIWDSFFVKRSLCWVVVVLWSSQSSLGCSEQKRKTKSEIKKISISSSQCDCAFHDINLLFCSLCFFTREVVEGRQRKGSALW